MLRPSARSLLLVLLLSGCARSAAPVAAPAGPLVEEHPDRIVIPDDPSAPLPVDPRVRVGRLDNGLTFFVEPNRRPEGRAELRLAVRAGSILEEDDQRGLAHFVEHMAFNGTRRFPQSHELVAWLESIGTQFGRHVNAHTSFDETIYQLQVPTDDPKVLERAFLVLRDFADGVLFDPEECERERGVVLEEWRIEQGIRRRFEEVRIPLLYHGSRYAERLPIGTEESLRTFDCEAARRYYRTWYRPDLMAVMAVGDFDPRAVETFVQRAFGDFTTPEDAPPRPWFDVPAHDETLVGIFTDPELDRGGISLLAKVDDIEGDTHEHYRTFLLEQMVFVMFNERLAIASQDPDAAALAGMANKSSLGHQRAFHALTVAPKAGRELQAFEEVVQELERVKRHGFTQGELNRAREQMARNLQTYYDEREKTDSRTHVDELLRVFLTDEPMPGIPYEFALSRRFLPTMTVDEANAWARDAWFPDHSRVVQVMLPESVDVSVPSETALLGALRRVAVAELAPPEDDDVDGELMSVLPTPGRAQKVATDPTLGTSTWRLSNGATVVLKPTDFRQDEVLFEAFSPGGSSLVADEDFVAAATATTLLMRSGVGEHDAVALAKKLAGRQAHVGPSIGRTREFLSGGASVQDLEAMFQLLHLYVTAPRFDARAFELERQGMLESLRNRQANPDAVFEDAFAHLLWEGNVRQTPWRLDDVQHLDLARSERIYRERFADVGDWTFVFVGNLDEASVVPLIERYVASLPARGEGESWRHDGARRIAGVHELELPRGMTPRGRVRLLFHGPFEASPVDRLLLDAVGAILDRRLHEELRENKGGTYGASVQRGATKEPEGTYGIQIDFETDPERVDELLAETWAVVEEVRTTTYPASVTNSIRESNRRSRDAAMKTNGFWVAALAGALARGEDPRAEILEHETRNRAITPAAVRRMAERVLGGAQYVQAIQRPAAGGGGGAGGSGTPGAR